VIENRRRHGTNTLGHSGVYEYSMLARVRHTSLDLSPQSFGQMVQKLLYVLTVGMKRKKQMTLCRVKRQHRTQPDVELNQLRLRLTDTHNHGTIT
jgi:hypothetical protein